MTLDSVHSDVQSFRITPNSTIVCENENVTLFCSTSDRVGSVQWAKDGFILGKLYI